MLTFGHLTAPVLSECAGVKNDANYNGSSAMVTSFTFWLVVLAVLVAYLFVSVSPRRRAAKEARLHAIDREFPRRAFDASAVAAEVRRVRQDYAVSAHHRWRPAYHRSEMFAAARRLVTTFAYFRRRRHEHELHKPEA